MAQKFQVEDIRGGVRFVEADSGIEAASIGRDKGDEVLHVSPFAALLVVLFGSGDGDRRDHQSQ